MKFETTMTEQEVFDELQSLCASPGYVHILAMLSFRDNLVMFPGELTSEAMTASYAPERTVRTEFSTLLGLMLKQRIDFSYPAPEEIERLLNRTRELLEELHACLNQPMLAGLKRAALEAKAGLSIEEASPFLQGDVLREPIFYGSESAYSFQYRDLAVERYTLDNDWLIANKGFRIADGCAVADALSELANNKLSALLESLPELPPSHWSLLPGFTFSLDEISQASGLPPNTAEAVLDAFTAPIGPANADFNRIGDFNLANARPILRTPAGDYVSLQAYGVVESLYDSPYYWMAADKAYRNTAFQHRGSFTEEFTAKRLAAMFGEANVHRGVNIMSGAKTISEIDVLVIFADRAIVVQCKSKKLTLEARKGNDLQLRDDFKKAVSDAYDQAHLCATSLSDTTLKFIRADGVEMNIPSMCEIYPMCVVSDHYPALAAQARQYLSVRTDDVILAPLVGDVFLVDVLAEMLVSPLRFLSYVSRRVRYGDRINSIDELTILGFHLAENLWLEDETSLVTILDDFSVPLDTAMTVRRLGVPGESTPKGVMTKLDGTLVGRLLANIENRPDSVLIDLGFLLLSLHGDTLDDLNQGLKEIAEKTRKDKQSHDLTLAFDDNQSGLTIHCGHLTNSVAMEKLQDHCRRRKYIHRADSWFGLVVRADDAQPKFGIQLHHPWKHDNELEVATQDMVRLVAGAPRLAKGSQARTPKVGRNEPCPCGSGKKFKKCCLDKSF